MAQTRSPPEQLKNSKKNGEICIQVWNTMFPEKFKYFFWEIEPLEKREKLKKANSEKIDAKMYNLITIYNLNLHLFTFWRQTVSEIFLSIARFLPVTPFFRMDPLLYHKFENMVIFR